MVLEPNYTINVLEKLAFTENKVAGQEELLEISASLHVLSVFLCGLTNQKNPMNAWLTDPKAKQALNIASVMRCAIIESTFTRMQ